MFSVLFGFFAKYKIILIAGVSLVAISFLSGYAYKANQSDKHYQKRLQIAVQAERDILKATEQKYKLLLADSDRITTQLSAKNNKLEVRNESLNNQIRETVNTATPDLTRGTVGLLNQARNRDTSRKDNLPQTSGLSVAEKREPSTITKSEEIRYHIECGIKYNKLAEKHDALIEWIEALHNNNNEQTNP